MNYRRKIQGFNAFVGVLAIALLAGCAGGDGLGDVGDQDDQPPVARAAVVGASEKTTGVVSVRAGSDVILTGKDSEDLDDPILFFRWEVSDSTIDLVERTTNSVVFKAPSNVDAVREIDVTLTVTNADEIEATDTVTVRVEPVGDLDEFLVNPNISRDDKNKFKLRATLAEDIAAPLASDEDFSITLDIIAHWPSRLDTSTTPCVKRESEGEQLCEQRRVGGRPSLDGNLAELSGTWPINSPGGAAQTFTIAVPSLDVDEINKHFQDPNPDNAFRNKRLELDAVSRAYIEVRAALSAGVRAELKFGRGNNDEVLEGENIPSGTTVSVDADKIRQALCSDSDSGNTCLESKASAQAYYDVIDPMGMAARLSRWLDYAGFGNDPENQPGVAHTVYVNNFDLGFGRDMFMRKDACGNLYSYVVNYNDLENAVLKTNDFATVVMEYSPIDNSGSQDDSAACSEITNNDEKIVKFYSYVPDESAGDYVRITSMNFDGRGEKFVPGVCTNCHSGTSNINVKGLVAFGEQDPTQKLMAGPDERKLLANLKSSFMPWDLDSFLYAGPEGGAGVEPSYSRDQEVADKFLSFSRDEQSESFRQLNEMTMQMWSHYQNTNPLNEIPALGDSDPRSFASAMEMMEGWYGGDGGVATPNRAFDGTWIPNDWMAETELYENVFIRNCRMCHVQIEKEEIDFHSYNEFLNNETEADQNARITTLTDYVFQRGIMPLARLTMDRFWLGFTENEPSAREGLIAHINSIASADQQIALDARPGLSVPKVLPAGDNNNHIIDFDEPLNLNASSSLFADSFVWTVDGVEVSNNNEFDIPADVVQANPGGSIEVNLDVFNAGAGLSSASPRELLITVNTRNNVPAPIDLTETVTEGQAVEIDIFARNCDDVPSTSACRQFFGDIQLGSIPELTIADGSVIGGALDTIDIASGQLRFTPNIAGGSGVFGEFRYDLTDSFGQISSDAATVIININAAAGPEVMSDSCSVSTNTTFSSPPFTCVNPLLNDSSDGGFNLSLEAVETASNPEIDGSATINGDDVQYTPPRFFVGQDQFTYTVRDDSPGMRESIGVITVTVEESMKYSDLTSDVFDLPQAMGGCGGCHGMLAGAPDWTDYETLIMALDDTVGRDGDGLNLVQSTSIANILNTRLFERACNSSHSGNNRLCTAPLGGNAPVDEDSLNDVGKKILRWIEEGARNN